jgi:hypothetical protein
MRGVRVVASAKASAIRTPRSPAWFQIAGGAVRGHGQLASRLLNLEPGSGWGKAGQPRSLVRDHSSRGSEDHGKTDGKSWPPCVPLSCPVTPVGAHSPFCPSPDPPGPGLLQKDFLVWTFSHETLPTPRSSGTAQRSTKIDELTTCRSCSLDRSSRSRPRQRARPDEASGARTDVRLSL